jgi:ParB/RepB/Spo0J family partition protein
MADNPERVDNSPAGDHDMRIFQLDLLQEGLVDVESIDVGRVQPNRWQPRADSDGQEIDDLAASIAANGLLHAIIVRPVRGGMYELIAGERRWRAVRLLGWTSVPARVLHHVDDSTAAVLALVENVDRRDLTAWEEAQAVAGLRSRLLAAGRPAGGAELGRLFGWSVAKVSERLTIAESLPPELIAAAGLQIHDVNNLSKLLLLNASRAPNNAAKVSAIAAAINAGLNPDSATPPPPRRKGRPEAGFTFQRRRSGRISLQLRRPVAQLEGSEAKALLERLEPLVDELRRRALSG